MAKNVTLKLDENLLKLCRFAAVEEDKSLSQWLADLIKKTIEKDSSFKTSKKHALKTLKKGFNLSATPLSREEIHER